MEATVVNVRRVSPPDRGALTPLLEAHPAVVTIEENTIVGGFGSGILELLQEQGLLRPTVVVGLPAAFVTHGDLAGLYREIGFTPEAVAERARGLVRPT